MTELSSETIHATTVAIGGHAVMIEGPSGSGKSDLAIRLIDRGATLVSDDYTIVRRRRDALFASAPPTIIGRIELRGVGIVEMPQVQDVAVALVVRAESAPPRLPVDGEHRRVAGAVLPVMLLSLIEASAPIKVERRLAALVAAKQ